MKQAKKKLLILIQQSTFSQEFTSLESGQEVSRGSRLKSLSPVLIDGLICVGGRLQNSDLAYECIHPVILPPHHHVTSLLIRQCHERNGHVGVQQLALSIWDSVPQYIGRSPGPLHPLPPPQTASHTPAAQ